MKKLCYLFLALGLMACGGNNDNKGSEAGKDGNAEANAIDAAEVVGDDGKVSYRPDTAKVFVESGVDKANTFALISKKELRLKVYSVSGADTTLVAQYPVCLSRVKGQKQGSGDMKTPESEPGEPFVIEQIQDASTWTHDFGDGRGAILSYGHWFHRLVTPGHKGIGIHGSTNNEDKMPGRDSEGCIRMRDKDLDHFHDNYAHIGMKVTITAEDQGLLPFEAKAKKGEGKKLPL